MDRFMHTMNNNKALLVVEILFRTVDGDQECFQQPMTKITGENSNLKTMKGFSKLMEAWRHWCRHCSSF